MIDKLRFLIEKIKKEGLIQGLQEVMSFTVRPFNHLVERNRFFWELTTRFSPPFFSPGLVQVPQPGLVKEVRKFWYSNQGGDFDLDGEKIKKREIGWHGGPNPRFTCPICQKSEWLSRIRQKNLFQPHLCSQSKEAKELCSRQGDELWTHFHRNFDFSIGCDSKLPAPKCLYVSRRGKKFFNPSSHMGRLALRARLSYCCQMEVVKKPVSINWQNYDFIFLHNNGRVPKFRRPDLPIILYGHDFWPLGNKGLQWVIDWLKPDVFMSSTIGGWQKYYKFPSQTKVVFYPFFDPFFNRSNLGKKELDLLVIGAVKYHPVYRPRLRLNQQVAKLAGHYKIEFSNLSGDKNREGEKALVGEDLRSGKPIRVLNKWSEYLGKAKYVVFGRMGYPVLVSKYYETLGSGAIPIFPELPDLKYLGVKPFEHYIPLAEVEGDNNKLSYYLDHYQDYYYIAKNAVEWYNNFSDRMNFNYFEDLVREITNYKYPKRLI